MFTGSRNIPIYIRENAKQIQIALSAMGVNVQEDIIFEALGRRYSKWRFKGIR